MGVAELRGIDEMAVRGTGTVDAIALLDSVLGPAGAGRLPTAGAADLTSAERDDLLVAALARTYGPTISSTVGCGSCGEPFDLDFSLPDLVKSAGAQTSPLPGGVRLPTGADELAVMGLTADRAEAVLVERCVGEGADRMAALAAIEPSGRLVDIELDAACPECGERQPVTFDVQTYLLTTLTQDRARLVGEVHLLASAYGWHLAEILSLPRSDRRRYAALVDADRARSG